jgi:hypothetical protein
VSVDSEALLVIDFVNFKIKSAQSFEGAYKDRVCIHVFIEVSTHIYIYIYISMFILYFKKMLDVRYEERKDCV